MWKQIILYSLHELSGYQANLIQFLIFSNSLQ